MLLDACISYTEKKSKSDYEVVLHHDSKDGKISGRNSKCTQAFPQGTSMCKCLKFLT